MEEKFLQEARNELVNGHSKRGHPFRYFTLATQNGAFPRQRTVVLRKMLPDYTLRFYTDARSQKITDFKKNTHVSALFYHPKKLIQLRMECTAEIVEDENLREELWKQIPEKSKKDYITSLPPGSKISNPDNVEYQHKTNHFTVVHLHPIRMEYLRLKRPNHIRILFERAGDDWQGQFLVP